MTEAFRDNAAQSRFELAVDGHTAFVVYRKTPDTITLVHTEVPPELGGRGITVNAIAPGPIETNLFLTGKTEEQVRAMAATNPQGRLGQPDDIAGVAAFLAGPDGGWVSGQVLRANGGVI